MIARGTSIAYTSEQDEWLRKNYDLYTWPDLTKLFNEKFDRNLKSVSDHVLKTLRLKKTVNRGNCTKGTRRNTNTLPIGSERFNGFDVYVKISDDINDCRAFNGHSPSKHKDSNWRRKDYIVWESAGNRLPADSNEILIHLNKDKHDCDIDNLYLTTRTINFMMAKNGWYSENREQTLTAIKICELFYAIKGKKSELQNED